MLFGKPKEKEVIALKGDYVVVIHNWFVESKGFKHFVFKDMTFDQVEREAKVICHDNNDTFSKCAYTIVKFQG